MSCYLKHYPRLLENKHKYVTRYNVIFAKLFINKFYNMSIFNLDYISSEISMKTYTMW